MKTQSNTNLKRNVSRRLSTWILIVSTILTIPFLLDAPWTGSDFIFAAIVLFGSALMYELITKNMDNQKHRIAVAIGVLGLVIFIWGIAVSGP